MSQQNIIPGTTSGTFAAGDDARLQAGADAAIAAAKLKLSPWPVATNYSARAQDLVLCDTTSFGSFTVTLPEAPPDATLVGIKKITDDTNQVTVQSSGDDYITGLYASPTLVLIGQAITLFYNASLARWYQVNSELSIDGIDSRYATQSNVATAVTNQAYVDAHTYAKRGVPGMSLLAAFPNLMAQLRNYNDATKPTMRLLGLGSQVGLGPDGNLNYYDSPVAYIEQLLIPQLNRLNNQTWATTNGSVYNSSIWDGANGDYNSAKTNAGGSPALAVLAYGMNEGTPANYFSGATYLKDYNRGLDLIEQINRDYGDVILFTTPHLNTSAYDFTYGGPYTYPGSYVPTAANSLVNVPSPSGPNVTANYLHLRVNESIRKLAADTGTICIDVEPYWFDNLAQYDLINRYSPGATLAPNTGGIRTYYKAIQDFVTSVQYSTVQIGTIAGNRYKNHDSQTGGNVYLSTGGSFTIPVNAGQVGTLMINGSSGGGWHSVWTGSYTAVGNNTVVTQITSAASETNNVFASVTGSSTSNAINVTARNTGSDVVFSWSMRSI